MTSLSLVDSFQILFSNLPQVVELLYTIVDEFRITSYFTKNPLLIALRLYVSLKEPANNTEIPRYLSAVAACSRELPVPKIYPPTSTSPSFTNESK